MLNVEVGCSELACGGSRVYGQHATKLVKQGGRFTFSVNDLQERGITCQNFITVSLFVEPSLYTGCIKFIKVFIQCV